MFGNRSSKESHVVHVFGQLADLEGFLSPLQKKKDLMPLQMEV